VSRRVGRSYDRWNYVVIPSIGVIVGDDYRDFIPFSKSLETIDRVHKELLLGERIGVAGMSVSIARSFQVADFGKITGVHRRPEIDDVVLVVGLVCVVTDQRG